MNRNTNWPGGVNYGHPNYTLRTPRTSSCRLSPYLPPRRNVVRTFFERLSRLFS